jgi:signal peptidase I
MAVPPESSPSTLEQEIEHIGGKRDLARAIFLCVLTVFVVRSFVFEPFKIPSSSMVPTLEIGDHIFVSKYNYGLSLPFSKIQLLRLGAPKRGEIIVFLFPREEALHYIKRVVGIPGDKIEFRGRDLIINGKLVEKEKVTDPAVIEQVTGKPEMSGELYRERIGDSVHYIRFTKSGGEDYGKNSQVELVPPDHYLVVGDNRDDSYDSRAWGTVPKENIKGKAQMIWLSLDQEENWGRMQKVRWSRAGKLLR